MKQVKNHDAFALTVLVPAMSAVESGAPRLLMSSQDPERTVRAGRRRPSDGSSGPRERADTPERESSGGGSGGDGEGGSGGGGLPPSFGGRGGLPPNINPWILIVGAILVVCFLVVFGGAGLLNPSQESSNAPQNSPTEIAAQGPTEVPPTRAPTRVPATRVPGAQDQKWLVMLYSDADDKILEQDIYFDLNEAEMVGSTDNVQLVAQVDRFKGAFLDDGNWTSARRYALRQDNDLRRIQSDMVQDLGEVNMADSKTLVDFVTWAVQNYPADKYVLILSDHGMGWPDGWTDGDSKAPSTDKAPLARAIGGAIFLNQLDDALTTIRQQTGIDKFELIGMDACLMSHLEVFSALEPHARFAVASQETEPAVGWAYSSFLAALNQNPNMDGGELGRLIVDSYIKDDQRILDDQARGEMMSAGRGLFGGAPSARQVAQQMEQSVTLTAVDLSKIPQVMQAVNQLAAVLQSTDQAPVAAARRYAESYTSIFGDNVPPSYIDLDNFTALLAQKTNDGAVKQAAGQVQAAVAEAVLDEKHGAEKNGSNGISIYFPNAELYRLPEAGPQSYTVISNRFAQESAWDDFLAFHYTGRPFEVQDRAPVVPDKTSLVRAPGAGKIELSPLKLSGKTAAPGKPVVLSTRVDGENIGYIYLFAGYYDEQANSINLSDLDYLDSGTTREVGGVFYPDWGTGPFNLEFEWEPIVFALTDGETTATVLLNPTTYGAAPEQAVYTVEGLYTRTATGETSAAQLRLNNGKLQSVFGFTNPDGTGAPREIVPDAGDTFTVYEKWMDLDADGQSKGIVNEKGKTLTFGSEPFTWKEQDAAAGKYRVGFIATDLEGNRTQVLDTVTVR